MNFNIIPENNKATIVLTSDDVRGVEALTALRDATTLCFKAKADKEKVALDLQKLAHSQIGSWTKFWDRLGSIFLSCFGYVTTAKKVDDVVKLILNKQYEIEEEKKESPKPLSPKLTSEEILQKEAKELVDSLLPDLSKLERDDVDSLAETLNTEIKAVDPDKQQACYDYLVSVDHYFLAIKFIDKFKPEVQQQIKDKYGLCPEFSDIAKKIPGFDDCFNNDDLKGIKKISDDLKAKNEISEAFFKTVNIILILGEINDLCEKEKFDEATKLVETIRFKDFKNKALSSIDYKKQLALRNFEKMLHELYRQEGHEKLNAYLETLTESKRNEAFFSLASVAVFKDAAHYASKITDEKLRNEAKIKWGLLTDEECEKVLSDVKFENTQKMLKSQDYLKALDHLFRRDEDPSIVRYVAVLGVEHYLKLKDYARLEQCLKRVNFDDLERHYRKLANEIPDDEKKRSKFLYRLSGEDAWYARYTINKEEDPALKIEGCEFVINNSESFYEALNFLRDIQDPSIKDKMIVKYGLVESFELEALPESKEMDRLLKIDREQAELYVKGLNSKALYLHYLRKAVDLLIDTEEYDKAALLINEIPFKDLRNHFLEKIKIEKDQYDSRLEAFIQEVEDLLAQGRLRRLFEIYDRVEKPSHKLAALEKLASQFMDSDSARKALDMIQNPELKKRIISATGLLQLNEIKNDEAKAVDAFLKDNKFNSARLVVDRSNITVEKRSLHRIIDEAEIRYLISQNKPIEAEKLIERLSYRNQRQELFLEVEMLKAKLKFPNVAKALSGKSRNVAGSELLHKLGKENPEQIFKDVEACDEYYVKRVFEHYYENDDIETAFSLGLLIYKYTEYYLEKMITKAVNSGDRKALNLLRILPLENEIYIVTDAFKELYFKDKAFVDALLAKYGNIFENCYAEIIKKADSKESAINLLRFIKDPYLLNTAKGNIAIKYGDLKLYIESTARVSWEYNLKEFCQNYKRAVYTSEELKSMEQIVDGLYAFNKDDINQLYTYLSESAADEADKVRLIGKRK